ncbi:microcephalin-like [Saccostrea echinata]|uniref:microcephalin-like n=1 Tax=Saccostrea echinata TaxID=191078 RepID=UPI002A82A297|nr:microcephalin-like [Saccostrea echinata]
MKHSKEGQKKKSTTPKKKSFVSSKLSTARTSCESKHQLEDKTSRVTFDVKENGMDVLAGEDRNASCTMDTDDDLPATQPIDDRVLKDVVAYVEVRSTNDNRSKAICRELVQLGAVVAKTFSNDVTHVVLKEGSKRTITKATKKGVHLVSVLWVDSCKQNQQHVSERLYPAMLPDQKGTPLLIAKLKKAKSMQPRDFEDDLASSAERFAKKKKKQEIDRLKSTESTPCNSPLLGAILVEDTQPRGSPLPNSTGEILTPIRLAIPDTPPSMRAKMKELDRQMGENNDDENVAEAQYDKPEFDEPLQRRLFTGMGGQDLNSPETTVKDVKVTFREDSPPVTSSKKDPKVRASSRRKSVASVCFKDNIENFQKKKEEESRNSLPAFTNVKDTGKRKSTQRRKSMAAVSFTSTDVQTNEEPLKRRVSSRRRSVQVTSLRSEPEIEEQSSKKSLEKIETFLESDRNADSENLKLPVEHAKVSGIQCTENICSDSGNASKQADISVTSNTNSVDGNRDSKSFTQIKNKRKSSVFAANEMENRFHSNDNTDCENVDSSSNKGQTEPKKQNIKILKPKKRLLAASDMEVHSFLIEPTMCSEKVFSKLLDNTPDSTSTQIKKKDTKGQGQKRKKHSLDEAPDTPKRSRQDKSESSSFKSPNSRISTGEDRVLLQHGNTDHDNRDVSENESTLGSSMSVVFSESTCSNLFGTAPPRQSIDEFNLRTKFNNKRMRKKKKALSDSAFSSLNNESDTSSTSEEGKKIKKMRRNPSFTKTSPQRPSLVMTSLHSHEQDIVISVVKRLKGFTITDHVNDFTTHVVCGGPRRTLNILHAITRGCWVLKKEWVMESLDAQRWLPEEGYEVTDWFPSAQETRFSRQTSKENAPQLLFGSMGVFYITPKAVPPRHHLMELIQRCAGKVTSSSSKADIYVGSDFLPEKTSVNPLWILDCVTQNTLLPMDSYLLGKPKRESSPEY